MKANYAGLVSAVPLTDVRQYLHNCNRKAYELNFAIPVSGGADVQVYIDFGTARPLSFTSTLVSLCNDDTTESVPCQYVLGLTPAGAYYGVFRFANGIALPAQFAFAIDVTMQDSTVRRYFTEAYQLETCVTIAKIEACFPESSNSLGYDTNGIYYGYTTDLSLSVGNPDIRYLHFVTVRKTKVFEEAPKVVYSSNIRQNFKTVVSRLYEVRTELVPKWYKEYLLAVYTRGFIQVDGKVYQVTDLAFEGIDDDDYTWKPYAKLKKEERFYYGCDSTPCSADCCSPCDVNATVEVISDPCCSPVITGATVSEVTAFFSNKSDCTPGDNFTSFVINGAPGSVISLRMVLGGFFNYGSIPGSPSSVTATGSFSAPTGATIDNNVRLVFPVPGHTGTQSLNGQSDLPFEVVIPSDGTLTVNTLANIENAGTPSFVAGVRIEAIDGVAANIYQSICAGYSSGA